MLRINNHEITGIYRGLRKINAVYDFVYIVWRDMILCCYSNGRWLDEYPWLDTEVWTDLK